MKRLITDNTGPYGELDTDAFQRAILQYRNCPDKETKLSPAMCVFGRPIKDFIPVLPGRYRPHVTWRETLAAREEALRNRHMRAAERWSEHTKQLPPLVVGDHVRIQNQIGPNPRKWDKTGLVIEVRQHDQYVARIDGSGRVTLRNRKFLRKYLPVCPVTPRNCIQDDLTYRTTEIRKPIINERTLPTGPRQIPQADHALPPQVDRAPQTSVTQATGTTQMEQPPYNVPQSPARSANEPHGTLRAPNSPRTQDHTPLHSPDPVSTDQDNQLSPPAIPFTTIVTSRTRRRPTWQTSGDYDMSSAIYGAK